MNFFDFSTQDERIRTKDSDMIILNLPDKCDIEDLPTQLILHTKYAKKIFINGEEIKVSRKRGL